MSLHRKIIQKRTFAGKIALKVGNRFLKLFSGKSYFEIAIFIIKEKTKTVF